MDSWDFLLLPVPTETLGVRLSPESSNSHPATHFPGSTRPHSQHKFYVTLTSRAASQSINLSTPHWPMNLPKISDHSLVSGRYFWTEQPWPWWSCLSPAQNSSMPSPRQPNKAPIPINPTGLQQSDFHVTSPLRKVLLSLNWWQNILLQKAVCVKHLEACQH